MNIKNVAEKLNLSVPTLRLWEGQFGINVKRGSRNRREYDENVIQILEKVKDLKSNNSGLNTIRKVLHQDNNNSSKGDISLYQSDNEADMSLYETAINMKEIVKKEVFEVITNNNELAEKYAKATYTIGQQENEIKHLTETNNKLEEKIKLLPEPSTIKELNGTIEQINEKNELLKLEVDRLKKENEYIKLPWWKKILKNN